MYSCFNACKMRALGVDKQTCKLNCVTTNEVTRGCTSLVNDFTFLLCNKCPRDGCRTRWPTTEECKMGCEKYDKGKTRRVLGLCPVRDTRI